MLVILLWCGLVGRAAAWDVRFAVDYFDKRDIRHVCLVLCDVSAIEINLARALINNDVRVSMKTMDGGLTDLQNYLYPRTAPVGVLLDGTCKEILRVLVQLSRSRLFDATHIWLILSDTVDGNAQKIDVAMQQMNLSVDADVVLATYTGDQYKLIEIFNFGKIQGNELERKYLGTWRAQSGLNISLSTFKYYDRWDFHNLTLRVITVVLGRPKIFEPEMLTSLTYTKGISVFTKTAAIVLEPLKDIHNFRFNYTVAGRWIGPPDRNASLAVTNSLYWREQDISCTSARINTNWLQWVDVFHPPVTKLESRFFYLIPDKGIGNYENRFLTPLSPIVWWCSTGIAVFCAVVLAAAAAVERRPKPGIYAILSVVGAVCQQAYEEGVDVFDQRISSQGRRVTVLVIGVTSMLLYNYYTSSVVSWLLSAAPPTLSDINGLINSDFELIFEDIGYTRGWFEDAGFFYYGGYKNPKEDELRDKKVKHAKRTKEVYQPVEYGIELIRTGDYAYHTEPYTAYQTISRTFTEAELCRLGSLPMIHPAPVYIMTQKRSPYKEFFDWSLTRLNERGHVSACRARVSGAAAACAGRSPRALALGQAAPAVALLAGAAAVALFILFLEILWYRLILEKQRLQSKKHKRIVDSPGARTTVIRNFLQDYKKTIKD